MQQRSKITSFFSVLSNCQSLYLKSHHQSQLGRVNPAQASRIKPLLPIQTLAQLTYRSPQVHLAQGIQSGIFQRKSMNQVWQPPCQVAGTTSQIIFHQSPILTLAFYPKLKQDQALYNQPMGEKIGDNQQTKQKTEKVLQDLVKAKHLEVLVT